MADDEDWGAVSEFAEVVAEVVGFEVVSLAGGVVSVGPAVDVGGDVGVAVGGAVGGACEPVGVNANC